MTTLLMDYMPETLSLLEALESAGFVLRNGNDGEERFYYNGNREVFAKRLTAVDSASFNITLPDKRNGWVFLVFGNEPGYVVNDYAPGVNAPALDAVMDAENAKWEGKEQPTKEG